MDKREFIKTLGGASLGLLLGDRLWAQYSTLSPAALAEDEPFWLAIREKYRLKPDFINLENGYYSMQSKPVLDAFVARVNEFNYEGSYYMRTRREDDKLAVRKRLAALVGCSHEELIITRNTTESLDTVIAGFDWKPGDEAVMAAHDYGAMLDMFKLQARRHGMTNTVVTVPLHPRSDAEIVQIYEKAITPKTRLLMCCHVVNITGQILPVRAISEMAHSKGVQVMVDGAHAIAHLDFRIPDLGVDYYGASLHKWLGTPLGAGILYVRADRIEKLWPIYGTSGIADTDIRKLNHTGTHPVHTDVAINAAIDFHEMIGIQRKEARLRYLQNYWTSRVRDIPRIQVNTPADPARSGAIANVGIAGIAPRDLSKALLDTHGVWTVAINNSTVQGARITPHVYTTTAELDKFIAALKTLAG